MCREAGSYQGAPVGGRVVGECVLDRKEEDEPDSAPVPASVSSARAGASTVFEDLMSTWEQMHVVLDKRSRGALE